MTKTIPFFSLSRGNNIYGRYPFEVQDSLHKYEGYSSISPLILHLTENKTERVTYWTSLQKTKYSKFLLENVLEPIDIIELKKFICHGNCIYEFAKQYFRRKARPFLIERNELYIKVLDELNKIRYRNIPERYGYQEMIDDLAGLALIETFNSDDRKELCAVIDDYIIRERICPICSNKYKVIFFPEWLYKRMNGNVHICYECPSKYPYKSKMPDTIKSLVEFLGFIPNSGFQIFRDDSFSARVPQEKWTRVFSLILELGGSIEGIDYAKKHFGSWFKALIQAGVLQNGQLETKRGIRCVSKSGNECNSLDEQFIDNYLFENGYKMEKEPKYPFHDQYNPRTLLRADWLVKGKYIEYFGLKGENNYDLKTANKIKLCGDLGLDLLAIYPEDLSHLDRILKFL